MIVNVLAVCANQRMDAITIINCILYTTICLTDAQTKTVMLIKIMAEEALLYVTSGNIKNGYKNFL